MTLDSDLTEPDQPHGVHRPDSLGRLLAINALIGAFAWIGLLSTSLPVTGETALIERLLLVAPLVTVPLGLAVAIRGHWALVICQPIAAGAAILSFLCDRGPVAAVLAGGWFAFTGLVALFGLSRRWARGVRPLHEFCVDAGLIYLPVGGAWLVASRMGLQPMGFGDTIVLLTAVHFHFAGFAVPILAGKAGQALRTRNGLAPNLYVIAAAGVIAGPPLVALGISTSATIEVVSAILLGGAIFLLAFVTALSVAPRCRSRVSAVLLVCSSISLVATMALAGEYTIGHFVGSMLIDIPLMARTHGVINVFGATLCGLTGWYIESRSSGSQ